MKILLLTLFFTTIFSINNPVGKPLSCVKSFSSSEYTYIINTCTKEVDIRVFCHTNDSYFEDDYILPNVEGKNYITLSPPCIYNGSDKSVPKFAIVTKVNYSSFIQNYINNPSEAIFIYADSFSGILHLSNPFTQKVNIQLGCKSKSNKLYFFTEILDDRYSISTGIPDECEKNNLLIEVYGVFI